MYAISLTDRLGLLTIGDSLQAEHAYCRRKLSHGTKQVIPKLEKSASSGWHKARAVDVHDGCKAAYVPLTHMGQNELQSGLSEGGKVTSTPTICRLLDSRRHQLSAIARTLLR